MTDETHDPARPVDNDHRPNWYLELPPWGKVLIQLGAFGLIALLFAVQSREQANQLRQFQEDGRAQAREDRTMFREELGAQRTEMRAAVYEMKRAIDALERGQRALVTRIESKENP